MNPATSHPRRSTNAPRRPAFIESPEPAALPADKVAEVLAEIYHSILVRVQATGSMAPETDGAAK